MNSKLLSLLLWLLNLMLLKLLLLCLFLSSFPGILRDSFCVSSWTTILCDCASYTSSCFSFLVNSQEEEKTKETQERETGRDMKVMSCWSSSSFYGEFSIESSEWSSLRPASSLSAFFIKIIYGFHLLWSILLLVLTLIKNLRVNTKVFFSILPSIYLTCNSSWHERQGMKTICFLTRDSCNPA